MPAFELICKGVSLDLPTDTSGLVMLIQYESSEQIGAIKGSGSYSINLPQTARNTAFFAAAQHIDVPIGLVETLPGKFDPLAYNDAVLLEDGAATFIGQLIFREFAPNSYRVQLISQNADWIAQSKGRKVGAVNLDTADYRYDRWIVAHDVCAVIRTATWVGDADLTATTGFPDAFEPCCFPLIRYNTAAIALDAESYFRPAAFVWPLVLAHFDEMGWQIESEFFGRLLTGNETGLLPLALPFTNAAMEYLPWDTDAEIRVKRVVASLQTIPMTGANRRRRRVNIAETIDVTGEGQSVTLAGAGTSDSPNGTPPGTTFVWVPVALGKYRLSGTVAGTVAGAGDAEFQFVFEVVQISTGTRSRQWIIGNAGLGAFSIDFDIDIYFSSYPFPAGDIAIAYYAIGLGANYRTDTLQLSTATFVDWHRDEGLFDVRENLPDYTFYDLCTSLTQMFNLRWQTDQVGRVVMVEPYRDLVRGLGPDISTAVDRPTFASSPLSAGLKRYLQWVYKVDSKDILVPAEQDEATALGYAAYELENPNSTTNGIQAYGPLFAATADEIGVAQQCAIVTDDSGLYKTAAAPRIVCVGETTGSFSVPFTIPVENCGGGPTDYGWPITNLSPGGTATGVTPIKSALFCPTQASIFADVSLAYNTQRSRTGLWERFWAAQFVGLADQRILQFELALARLNRQQLLDLTQRFGLDGHYITIEQVRFTPGGTKATITATLNDYTA